MFEIEVGAVKRIAQKQHDGVQRTVRAANKSSLARAEISSAGGQVGSLVEALQMFDDCWTSDLMRDVGMANGLSQFIGEFADACADLEARGQSALGN